MAEHDRPQKVQAEFLSQGGLEMRTAEIRTPRSTVVGLSAV